MDETIHIKYLWKTKEIVTGYKYHQKSSNTYRIFGIAYFVIGIFNVVSGLYNVFVNHDSGSWLFVALGLYLLFANQIKLFFYARNCKQSNYENKQVEWEINKDIIIHRSINLSESKFSWDLIQGVLDTPDGFLLYPQKNMFYWLPKKAFNNEEDIAHFVFIAKNNVKNWQEVNNYFT